MVESLFKASILTWLCASGSAEPSRLLTTSRTITNSAVVPQTSQTIDSWTLSGTNAAVGDVSIEAKVPGQAHLALLDAGILSTDPYYRYQELNYSWVCLSGFESLLMVLVVDVFLFCVRLRRRTGHTPPLSHRRLI